MVDGLLLNRAAYLAEFAERDHGAVGSPKLYRHQVVDRGSLDAREAQLDEVRGPLG